MFATVQHQKGNMPWRKGWKHRLNIWNSLCTNSTFNIFFHKQIQLEEIPFRIQNFSIDTCGFNSAKSIKFPGTLSWKNHTGLDKIP